MSDSQGRLASAGASGATITLTAIALGNGTDGVPDTGSATLTVAGLTKTHNWGINRGQPESLSEKNFRRWCWQHL
jgi:hypothetical protein